MVKFFRFDIYELINHYKVTFFSARTSQNCCHFHRHVNHVRFSSTLRKRATRKIFSGLSVTYRIIRTRSSIFCYLIYMNIYTRNLPVCNSGQYIHFTGLRNFFFVLQDLIDRINSYFQRIAFQRNLLLIGF